MNHGHPLRASCAALVCILSPLASGCDLAPARFPDAEASADHHEAGVVADSANLDLRREIDRGAESVVADGATHTESDAGETDRPPLDRASRPDVAGIDAAASPDAAGHDRGAQSSCGCYPAPFTAQEPGRGLRWVRNNPMFISALSVSLGPPPAQFVHDYYEGFNATATHLWADGLPGESAAWVAAGREDLRFVAWLDHDGNSAANGQLLGGAPPDIAHRIGYQIGDEPGQTCGDRSYECALAQLQGMSDGIDAVREVDPDALIYVNFNNHRELEALLEYYGAHVDGDLVSFDRYNRGWGEYETMELVRRAALDQGKPYWRFLEAFYDRDDPEAALTESDLRWSAFAGLLYGFTGHTWFVYSCGFNHDIRPALYAQAADFGAAPTELWQLVAQINVELQHLGRALTQLTSTDVRYLPAIALALPTNTTRWEPSAGQDPFLVEVSVEQGTFVDLSLGFFRDGLAEHYLMVQNVSHAGGELPTSLGDAATIRLTFDFECCCGAVSDAQVLSLDRVSGEVVGLPLSAAGGLRFVELELAAGDVVLLKYDSGLPFAGVQG